MQNNSQKSNIYWPNKAFVHPFVILPDIWSGGIASGVEARMCNPELSREMHRSDATQICNPHPQTSQCHVNQCCFRRVRLSTAMCRTCNFMWQNLSDHIPYVHAHISTTHIGSPRVSYGSVVYQLWYTTNAANKNTPHAILVSHTMSIACGRIGNSAIVAYKVDAGVSLGAAPRCGDGAVVITVSQMM